MTSPKNGESSVQNPAGPSRWRPILDEPMRSRVLQVVREIADALKPLQASKESDSTEHPEHPAKDVSLANGAAGLALFFYFLHQSFPNEGHDELAMNFLNQSIRALEEIPMRQDLYGGFTGVAWSVEHLRNRLLAADSSEDPNEAIEQSLMTYIQHSTEVESYDLIGGLVGLGVFGLARFPRPSAVELLGAVVTRLLDLVERQGELYTWYTPPDLLPDHQRKVAPKGYYNLGLAHGVPGVIGFLGQCQALDILPDRIRPVLQGGVKWLLEKKIKDQDACFASWLTRDGNPNENQEPTRSAWCYGDPGVAAALLVAAQSLGQKAWKKEALSLARLAAQRSLPRVHVFDMGLCHGTAGLALFFNRMYQQTGESSLKTAAQSWVERTLAMRRTGEDFAGFPMWTLSESQEGHWAPEPGILTGAAGVGLALLAAATPIEPTWDQFMMLSPVSEITRQKTSSAPRRDQSPQKDQPFIHSGFFGMRTPLLPLVEMMNWSDGLSLPQANLEDSTSLDAAIASDRVVLRRRLQDWLGKPEVKDAIYVASPSLTKSLDFWIKEPDSERGLKVERSLVRYFLRMTARPTPFGLFAGCSVGTIGETTQLKLEPRAHYRRHTRLDMDYLCALTDRLGRESSSKRRLAYYPNSSLYLAASRWRYVETRMKDQQRSHHLVAVEQTPYLDATIERAKNGTSWDDLARALIADDPEITLPEAESFIEALIDNQVLLSELTPRVTGPEPIHDLVDQLKQIPEMNSAADGLDRARSELESIDATGLGIPPERYEQLAKQLEPLSTPIDPSRFLQVDMVKPASGATLGENVLQEITQGVELLYNLLAAGQRQNNMAGFIQEFTRRYEDREVPLTEALDEEVGIGFERSGVPGAEASPLLENLIFPPGRDENQTLWRPMDAFLLRKLDELRPPDAMELKLDRVELNSFKPTDAFPLPDAFFATVTLCAKSAEAINNGDCRILMDFSGGPSGAFLLGRFCHADPALHQFVMQHLRAEEALQPDAVLAEIVHLPEGRIGNILARPVLRDYEIAFLGHSGAPRERQIPITDLWVSVVSNRVVLRSRAIGREVVPRLTSAHNTSHPRNLGVYKFLCSLQRQNLIAGLSFNWGVLDSRLFLPRVTVDRLVLARARWRVTQQEIRRLSEKPGSAGMQVIQRWKTERRIPRWVMLADGDNELPIDWDNVLSIEAFLSTVKNRSEILLLEMYPGPDELCAEGPEGLFTHEIVVPFLRRRDPVKERIPAPRLHEPGVSRRFPPGSEWLYAKLYTGTSTADQIIREVLGPLTQRIIPNGFADRWFFIRYSDPDWHLRLRVHGQPETLRNGVLPILEQLTQAEIKQGTLWRIQFDTYEREWERYGGDIGIEISERIFCVDSQACLDIVQLLSGDEGADARWRLTLLGMNRLFDDLGFDLKTKSEVMHSIRDNFIREFRADAAYFKQQLSDRFRKYRKELEQLLDPHIEESHSLWPGVVVLRERSERLKLIIADLQNAERSAVLTVPMARLAPSYLHMFANRLLRSAGRAQELVIYDFLCRIYESQLARKPNH